MSKKPAEDVARHIQRLEARLEKLRQIQAMLDEDPELATELLNVLHEHAAGTIIQLPAPLKAHKPEGQDYPTQVEEMIAFFYMARNQWQSVKQISRGTRLDRNSVNYFLYKSKHKDLFEGKALGPKEKVWRLKHAERYDPRKDQHD